jgi:hypothetical protein
MSDRGREQYTCDQPPVEGEGVAFALWLLAARLECLTDHHEDPMHFSNMRSEIIGELRAIARSSLDCQLGPQLKEQHNV